MWWGCYNYHMVKLVSTFPSLIRLIGITARTNIHHGRFIDVHRFWIEDLYPLLTLLTWNEVVCSCGPLATNWWLTGLGHVTSTSVLISTWLFNVNSNLVSIAHCLSFYVDLCMFLDHLNNMSWLSKHCRHSRTFTWHLIHT